MKEFVLQPLLSGLQSLNLSYRAYYNREHSKLFIDVGNNNLNGLGTPVYPIGEVHFLAGVEKLNIQQRYIIEDTGIKEICMNSNNPLTDNMRKKINQLFYESEHFRELHHVTEWKDK